MFCYLLQIILLEKKLLAFNFGESHKLEDSVSGGGPLAACVVSVACFPVVPGVDVLVAVTGFALAVLDFAVAARLMLLLLLLDAI
ncbi:Hypothetical predicted protein [Octopus vulgaris]|uniref:Uncharacterized protein n=1 Tax=Octopus vulgaris TaxID=6645 RepID=A0AA36AF43_OCTVU|nr:Hypothetical predicted protein [Octopus vulgaris]